MHHFRIAVDAPGHTVRYPLLPPFPSKHNGGPRAALRVPLVILSSYWSTFRPHAFSESLRRLLLSRPPHPSPRGGRSARCCMRARWLVVVYSLLTHTRAG